ncbi:MAG: hypothetical protein HC851_21170 [Acaryochloris sp. RU_4_1]|nr:hypothetical protein [Acaryochloris sp. RU_4_1]
MAEFGLKKFPRGVFQQSYPEQTLTEDPDPLKDFMNTISYVGSLHVYATQEGGTPAYLPDHEVSYVTVFLVFNGLDIDSNGEPVMDQDSLYVPAEQKGQVLEYGSSTIDKFWKVLEFWTEMRFNQSIGELRSIVGKGSIASRNGDGVYDEELDINNVWKTEKYPYGIISVVRVDQQFGVVVVRL